MSWKWAGEPGQGYSRLYKLVVPRPVRRWGGYGRWATGRFGYGAQKARAYRLVRYWLNFGRDMEARALGYCNHAPWPKQGGYAFWRCARKRTVCRSLNSHRSNNYTWWRSGLGTVEYNPIAHKADWSESLVLQIQATPRRDRYNRRTLRQIWAWRQIERRERDR